MAESDPIVYRPASEHKCRRFENKTCIVTAGTAGIGLAAAHRMASEGARVFVCSRKPKNVSDAVAELNRLYGPNVAGGVECNVTKPGEQEKFVSKALEFFNGKTIDCVVSNVGVNPTAGPSLELSESNYDKLWSANVKSHWELMKLVRPHLTCPGASIVLVSSVGGFTPAPPLGLYGVTKTALIALGKVLASELGPDGIRINTLCPGVVKTRMAELLWKSEGSSEARDALFLRKFADPEEMAGTVAFLLSRDSSHMTGESVIVAGGVQARL